MTQPVVSVMMITYQHAPFIGRAIEGVLSQQVDFPMELVIGEDCSTDGTREIVFDYHEKNPDVVHVITSDVNVGGMKNADRTGSACRGKYMAYCEGDDYWHNPTKLQKQVDYLEANPQCGLVYSDYDVYHVGKKKRIPHFVKYRNLEPSHDWTLTDFASSDESRLGVLTCTVMVRKNLRDQIIVSDPYLYNSKTFMMRDTSMWIEIAAVSSIHYIPESLATHNIVAGSITQNPDIKERHRFRASSAQAMLYLGKKYRLPKAFNDRYLAEWCRHQLRFAFYTQDLQMADAVTQKHARRDWKDRLLYRSIKSKPFWYALRTVLFIANNTKKRHGEWF